MKYCSARDLLQTSCCEYWRTPIVWIIWILLYLPSPKTMWLLTSESGMEGENVDMSWTWHVMSMTHHQHDTASTWHVINATCHPHDISPMQQVTNTTCHECRSHQRGSVNKQPVWDKEASDSRQDQAHGNQYKTVFTSSMLRGQQAGGSRRGQGGAAGSNTTLGGDKHNVFCTVDVLAASTQQFTNTVVKCPK